MAYSQLMAYGLWLWVFLVTEAMQQIRPRTPDKYKPNSEFTQKPVYLYQAEAELCMRSATAQLKQLRNVGLWRRGTWGMGHGHTPHNS
jgi:CRISPR/Cas system CSM-associated protein Csm3 (group 7 of RAMP superfamily)